MLCYVFQLADMCYKNKITLVCEIIYIHSLNFCQDVSLTHGLWGKRDLRKQAL